ncbi:MAG TPA: amino acid adenylation domain-containing protein, partial [Longimicrobiaceae bacterium]|nr:amino acid adenylation domain-containing protein [Longimicrobiaceae bacterium]
VEAGLAEVFARPVLSDFARELEKGARLELPPIEPAAREGGLPLSFAQQRLWFLEQLGAAGRAYHVATRLRLGGDLDRAALVRALDRIVARHEALRTTFHVTDGDPAQRIAPAEQSSFHLLEHDLSGHPGVQGELARLMAEEAGTVFDLERGPLIRGRLVRLGADEHVLLMTMHHIVSDGWSMGVLTRELGTLYAAFRRGDDDPLPPLPVQYADYAAWQRRWVDGEVLLQQAQYWKQTLSGAPELLELPADRARPVRQDHAGAFARLVLEEALTAGLKALCRRNGTTLFMTLLAGWAVVLSRLSGQADVVVGTPTANRGRSEIEGLIGFFANTLALRLDLSGPPTTAELLGRVKARALGAQQHQDIPFEQVVERMQPVRSLAHAPLFQVMFAWQNAPGSGLDLPGLTLAPVAGPAQATAKFDLSLALSEAGGRVVGGLTYATSLFERATVERYARYLRRVLEGMAADESLSVSRLPLLPEAERLQVVQEWNATAAAYPGETCIHRLFESQVERAPDAVAVVSEDGQLTYAQLNARANRLAHHLRERGVGPDSRVAVCAERGLHMVVGLLAILKAGGAYVPLDPAYPRERLGYMLRDSAPVVLLAQGSLAGVFDGIEVPVLEIDAAASGWMEHPRTNPEHGDLRAGHLAYVIYTSGSTGAPKGVMVEHRSVANHVAWQCAAFGIDSSDTVLQRTSISFDASVWEIWTPLAVGARMLLLPVAAAKDPGEIGRVIQQGRVSIVQFVPALFQAVLGELPEDARLPCRYVFCGGDPLPARLVEEARARGVRDVVNLYGPTEATIDATAHVCRDLLREGRAPSIGAPISNTRVYIVDDVGEPVPVGVAGELWVGGAGLARGYLDRPELTAERFVPDPFSGGPGARLYRTGDLGRWRTDGTIEFLGRNDFQVKVRGFRVELLEIAARLSEHPVVREAVVLAREDSPGDRRLVAYYVASEMVGAEALRASLSERLPEYMVPAAYVWLEALPLTPSGKVDRGALPAPGGDAYATRAYEAPVGEAEEALSGIWAELLNVEPVGRRDNFFNLGGHSFLAVQVVSRMRQVFGVEVALADIFSHPTVESLASRVRGAERRVPSDRAIPVRSTGSERPLFLVHEGAGSVAYAQVLHPHVDAEIPVYALPAQPAAEPHRRTVEGMATRLVRMIREVQPAGPYRLAGWSFGGILAYETAAQLIGQDQVVEFVGMMDTHYLAGARAGAEDAGYDHALLLRVLRMAEAAEESTGPELEEQAAAAADVDLQTFVGRCREEGLLPGHVTAVHAQEMQNRLRANRRALREYFPQPISIPVCLFPARGSTDPDLRRGWEALLADSSIRVSPVPGTHLSMMEADNVGHLGAALSREIGLAAERERERCAGSRSRGAREYS